MAGCAEEHHTRKVGFGETGDTDSKGGGRSQGVVKFLQGGGAINSNVWVGDVVNFIVNGKEGIWDIHRVPVNDHRGEIEGRRRQDMGDARGRRRVRGIGNPFGEYLHRATSGNRGSVGGATSLI